MKMSKIKVLHLITDLEPGGAENLLLDITRKLDKEKFNLLVCYIYGCGTLAEQIKETGTRVYDLSLKGRIDPLLPFRLFSLMRREKIRILHTHLVHASIVGRLVAKLAGIRSITTTRHYAYYNKQKKLVNWIEGKTALLNDNFIAVSRAVKDHMVKRENYDPREIEVIQNAVDLTLFDSTTSKTRSNRDKRFLLGTVGRLHPSKGYDTLLRSLPQVMERFPQMKLMIAGNGEEEEHMRQLCHALKISERVMFLGRKKRSEIFDLLQEIDIFVLASNWEGLPMAALEAMASGIAVVATKVGGLPEIVDEGKTGFLVPPAQPNALAEKINYLLRNREVCMEMGRKGREKIKVHFSIERMMTKLELLYQDLVDKSQI